MKEIIDFKYRDSGKDDFNNRKHSHGSCYEVLFVREGSGVFMVKDRLFPICAGGLYCINGMDIHCSVPEAADKYIRSKLVIESEYVNRVAQATGSFEIIEDLFITDGGSYIETNASVDFDALFLKLRGAVDGARLYAGGQTAAALLDILTLAHKNKSTGSAVLSNQVSAILGYINNNLYQKVTLDELSGFVHMSKYHMCRVFKETTGMTILSYILSRRISGAKKKLVYTDLPISEIALSCGFSDFSYFSKMFHMYEGVTPREFRQAPSKASLKSQ